MQQNNLQESMDRYDLLNGIERDIDNNHVLNNNTGERLLEMSQRKYELLHGISNINKPKLNNEEERRGGNK